MTPDPWFPTPDPVTATIEDLDAWLQANRFYIPGHWVSEGHNEWFEWDEVGVREAVAEALGIPFIQQVTVKFDQAITYTSGDPRTAPDINTEGLTLHLD